MEILKFVALSLTGLGAGLVVAGGIFAFIAVVGIVPRVAFRSNTRRYVKVYEEAIILGGIFGGASIAFNYSIPIGTVGTLITGLAYGIFVGCLAMCLAEVINVLPILTRRVKLQKGLRFFILSIACGKAAGALVYFFVDGFSS